ncbi:MAG: hypothetical protein K0U79_12115 [Gammaproteobacteria bacterium]|nr:hypothetical protein [Gammaproteobacteria bacterium]
MMAPVGLAGVILQRTSRARRATARHTEAKLRYLTHALAGNRNGLVVDVETTQANGRAEWFAAERMIARSIQKPGASLADDKVDDVPEFVQMLKCRGFRDIGCDGLPASKSSEDGKFTKGEGVFRQPVRLTSQVQHFTKGRALRWERNTST